MFVIENINGYGRFGNKLIYYLNMRNLANIANSGWCVLNEWQGEKIFNKIGYCKNFKKESFRVTKKEIKEIGIKGIIQYSKKYNILLSPPMLGEAFFEISNCYKNKNIESFLKREIKPLNNTCCIHFRGTDFKSWNPKAILPSKYYIDSIEWIHRSNRSIEEYIIFTDDKNLQSIKDVIYYLDEKKLKWSHSPDYEKDNKNKSFLDDFNLLCEANYIISTPSTFCISAGILGKSKIIHSKKWIESRVEVNDKFWVDLYNGGNAMYNVEKFI